MAKFLNTSATNYYLEELIKNASERLILISPFLKLNDRIRELLEDKDRLKIDIRIVYGKSELQPDEINWLKGLSFVRTSFCKNLHAKCYINESSCIITSLNLYEFSQVNNNEMGIFIDRDSDNELYKDSYEEAQRIIRISDEVRISLEKVSTNESDTSHDEESSTGDDQSKVTSSKLAKKHKLKTDDFLQLCVTRGYLTVDNGKHILTDSGKEQGGEFKYSKRFGPYFIWPETIDII
ncbi:phospholipase D family protein [Vibrio vulnificus]|uniref:phospholipase D family protein n=1 Tax=Vibrio vulnificus TaxID=672 RepID=UPI001028DD24|nr:phospholipase D family protein [Vibrio vulnificus]ELK8599299.1 phospholipase D family protein [Vibrio vulnificus]MCU8346322.1 phospholipase D family protein [Vibrio vulnificus]RZP82394.1 DNA repair protein [Vibrio vulnificus]RZR22578.1 DNA repair protein [Vibrio vulnificus]RZR57835.1 DNA repair protein [Vibrio vulnificus]